MTFTQPQPLWHLCGRFWTHQCAMVHWLQIAALDYDHLSIFVFPQQLTGTSGIKWNGLIDQKCVCFLRWGRMSKPMDSSMKTFSLTDIAFFLLYMLQGVLLLLHLLLFIDEVKNKALCSFSAVNNTAIIFPDRTLDTRKSLYQIYDNGLTNGCLTSTALFPWQ